MRLKPTIKGLATTQKPAEVKETPKTPKKGANKLPSDEYRPMFDPIRVLTSEKPSKKAGASYLIKQYAEISVKRFGEDGLPYVCLQGYQECPEGYTGYQRGKNITFPLEMLYDILEALQEVDAKCEELHIE